MVEPKNTTAYTFQDIVTIAAMKRSRASATAILCVLQRAENSRLACGAAMASLLL